MPPFPERKNIRLPAATYTKGHAFSITIATLNRYPWFRLYPSLAEKLMDALNETAKKRESALFAWCIMPDHIHLLLQDFDITGFVRIIKGGLTPLARRMEPGRTLWQRSFYDHGLRQEESTREVARYIWNNPIRAGMVNHAEDYPWSGSLVWPEWRNFTP